jgi:DNA-binding MarR family transcriptional regulator
MQSDEAILGAALAGVYDLAFRTTEAVAPALDEHGLTFNNAYVLWAIDPAEQPPSMAALARRTRCTPPNLSFLCGQLESRGLITRARSTTDGRQRVVRLTPAGHSARSAVVERILASSSLRTVPQNDLLELIRILGPIGGDPPGHPGSTPYHDS